MERFFSGLLEYTGVARSVFMYLLWFRHDSVLQTLPMIWSFTGSVLIGFHWLNYTITWQKRLFTCRLPAISSRLQTLWFSAAENLSHLLGSRWYHFPAFYCYHSQEKPWCLPPGRSHSLTWSSGSQNCQIPWPILWLRPQFYAGGEIEIWLLIHDALNFLLDNEPN